MATQKTRKQKQPGVYLTNYAPGFIGGMRGIQNETDKESVTLSNPLMQLKFLLVHFEGLMEYFSAESQM